MALRWQGSRRPPSAARWGSIRPGQLADRSEWNGFCNVAESFNISPWQYTMPTTLPVRIVHDDSDELGVLLLQTVALVFLLIGLMVTTQNGTVVAPTEFPELLMGP
jgi:hypothetical protein